MHLLQQDEILERRIRLCIWFFIIGLVISGATAIPLESEINWLTRLIETSGNADLQRSGLAHWFAQIREGLVQTNAKYPFMAYGTDWLAFGHFVIALTFFGPLRDPVKNIWVIEFGMIACVLVIPFALIMGGARQIPLGWRLIDCSFGVIGIVPLWYCRRLIRQLATGNKVSR